MARHIVWGIIPDADERPTIQFGYDDETKQSFIQLNNSTIIDSYNFENGEGRDSIVQKYSGKVDATHFGNKDYVLDDNGNPIRDTSGNIKYGKGAVVFGEANSNNADRAFVGGKLNTNTGSQALQVGLQNINTGAQSTQCGHYNENYADQTIQNGYKNKNYAMSAAQHGEQNLNMGYGSVQCGQHNKNNAFNSLQVGLYNENTTDNAIVGGYFCVDTSNALVKIGNGNNGNQRQNAFEVLKDGRAKVQTAPKEYNDVVRWQEYQKLITAIEALGGSVA